MLVFSCRVLFFKLIFEFQLIAERLPNFQKSALESYIEKTFALFQIDGTFQKPSCSLDFKSKSSLAQDPMLFRPFCSLLSKSP